MTPTVIEIGPHAVRGPNAVPVQWVSVAIECIDDQIGLLDERLVEVRRLWSDVLDAVAGEQSETLVLVFPTWWSSARVELVTAAAADLGADVVVLQRSPVLTGEGSATVLELSEEFMVISAPGAGFVVLPRDEERVAEHLDAATSILVDAPAGVAPLPSALVAQLRAVGTPVAYSDRQRLLRAVGTALPDNGSHVSPDDGPPSGRRAAAVLAGVVLAVAAVGGGWAAQALSTRTPTDASTELLREGRVEVRVPAQWDVERITSGPGSARLRVSVPSGDGTALHITQSTAVGLDIESLRRAFESEASDVFVDFDPAGSVGGTPALTYRELRTGSETAWAVVIDGATRIAIGCQSPPARRDAIRDVCEQAVRSARAVG